MLPTVGRNRNWQLISLPGRLNTQCNDTQHNLIICNTQYDKTRPLCWVLHFIFGPVQTGKERRLLLCWTSLCITSLFWVSWRPFPSCFITQTSALFLASLTLLGNWIWPRPKSTNKSPRHIWKQLVFVIFSFEISKNFLNYNSSSRFAAAKLHNKAGDARYPTKSSFVPHRAPHSLQTSWETKLSF